MNKKTIGIIGVIVLLIGTGYYLTSKSETQKPSDVMTKPTDGMPSKEDKTVKINDVMMKKESRYVSYAKAAFDNAKDKKRVYYFHAPWCPVCVPTDKEFLANLDKIPEDVMLFKTDYDTSTDLKKKYSITYQHTFVQVDSAGEEINKWNGGGIAELIANTK